MFQGGVLHCNLVSIDCILLLKKCKMIKTDALMSKGNLPDSEQEKGERR